MLPRRIAISLIFLLCADQYVNAGQPAGTEPQATNGSHDRAEVASLDQLKPIFKSHCVLCHGKEGEVNGDVDLVTIDSLPALLAKPELIRDLIDVIERREMPPEDEPRVSDSDRKVMLESLATALHASLAQQGDRGHAPIRRMNRFQYNNAVIDLFDLDCTVFTLPERMMREHRNYFRPETESMAETVFVGSRPLGKSQMIEPRLAGVTPFPQDLRAEHGFDNRGDHLSLSPLLMESFLKLGQSVTQSPDFTSEHVGIWNEFFRNPRSDRDRSDGDLPDDFDWGGEVRGRIEPFLIRAFRGGASPASIDRYVDFALGKLDAGDSFTATMKAVAAAAISSPRFLYLYDSANAGRESELLNDRELASRLSFFLWGSIPDRELISLADRGRLGSRDGLVSQVDRMLHDHKLKRFCDSFPSQWLQLERIISSVPNREIFPGFYFAKYRHSMHMMLEPLLLFETVLIENQSITQFIDSDFTYRSRLLREAYREELSPEEKNKRRGGEVAALTFDRYPVSDRRFGGLITNAAVMTMTSGPDRTQPITRGAWLRTVIFNDPPDPPPADVPPLDDKPGDDEEHLTLRERLDLHRQRADCKGCHEKIDPLGFALENFSPIGVWRDQYENGRAIDMQGILFREHAFEDVAEFKDAILAEKDRFTRAFAEHVLSFAVARELVPTDDPAVDRIASATAEDGYRIQTLIKQVVLSDPFLQKLNPRQRPANNEQP